jgi:hypothetical protein
MKGIYWIILSAALVGMGCLNLPLHPKEEAKPAPPPVQQKAPPAPPAVTADGITETNANAKAQALAQEIEYWSRTNDQ